MMLPWPDRFWPRVDATGDCWEWTANRQARGYGHVVVPGRGQQLAHRVAWELLVGPIPVGLQLDHLCRNTSCVNPDHLEPVTQLENSRRSPIPKTPPSIAGDAHYARQRAACKYGHPFTDANTGWDRGWRVCRTCAQRRNADLRARRSPSRFVA